MTTEFDPKIVRRIAQKHVRDDMNDVGLTIERHMGIQFVMAMGKHEYSALCSAVREAVRTGVLTWPVEQPSDERDAKPDACVCGDVNCMPYWRSVHEQMAAMRIRADKVSADFTKELLQQVCELATELDQLKARQEDAQDERDGDVRAVERARDLIEALWNGDAVTADAEHILAELDHRFGPHIAALEARDAKGDEQQ